MQVHAKEVSVADSAKAAETPGQYQESHKSCEEEKQAADLWSEKQAGD